MTNDPIATPHDGPTKTAHSVAMHSTSRTSPEETASTAVRSKHRLATATALMLIGTLTFAPPTSAKSLFAEDNSPSEQAVEGFGTTKNDFEDLSQTLAERAEKLKQLESIDPSVGQEHVGDIMEDMADILEQVKPGGAVEEALRRAINWSTERREAARNSQFMSAKQRQMIEELWSEEIAQMTQMRAEIETMRGTLEAEIENFDGTRETLEHLEDVRRARAMNLALSEIVDAMDQALNALRFENSLPDSTIPAS